MFNYNIVLLGYLNYRIDLNATHLCRIQRPRAWLRALNACMSYHSDPDRSPRDARYMLLYSCLNFTCIETRIVKYTITHHFVLYASWTCVQNLWGAFLAWNNIIFSYKCSLQH